MNKVFSAAPFIGALLLFCATSSWPAAGAESPGAADPAGVTTEDKVEQTLAQIAELRERVERLNLRAPEETGLTQRVAHRRLERAWGEIAASVRRLAADVATLQDDGVDRERFQDAVAALLPEIDGAIRQAVARVQNELAGLSPDEAALDPAALSNVYYARSTLFGRLIALYQASAGNLRLMPRYPVGDQLRSDAEGWLKGALTDTAQTLSLSLEVATDDVHRLDAQIDELPDEAPLKARRSVMQSRVQSLAGNLHQLVEVMDGLSLDVSEYRQQIVFATHQISDDLLDVKLASRLTASAVGYVQQWVTTTAPRIIVNILVLLGILLASWFLARIVGALVDRGMASRHFKASQLLRDLMRRMSRRLVLMFGLLVALSQIGISVGPLLAGLGVAGFVVGFAMQDSLSNFASGVLILFYRPFDVGDVIEAGDVYGKVRDMSLVNTTVLTFDNQTLVVPNTKIWGGVIRNVTAQHTRRVDMTFGIAYSDDIGEAERILMEIATAHEKTMDDPPVVVRLHELADSSVNFVVRPWVQRDDYWDVYWDITREVKVRFDAAGISIPFPQREVHVRGVERPVDPPTPTRAAAVDEQGAQPADSPDAPGSEGNGEAPYGEAPSSGSVG